LHEFPVSRVERSHPEHPHADSERDGFLSFGMIQADKERCFIPRVSLLSFQKHKPVQVVKL
jgi:hypothetical protein